jgi:hypothetical protein
VAAAARADAVRLAERLAREGTPWTTALALAIRAGLGDGDLEAVARAADAAGMVMHARAARYLAGRLDALPGIADPARYAATLIPSS